VCAHDEMRIFTVVALTKLATERLAICWIILSEVRK
jgi:hypothetical protein